MRGGPSPWKPTLEPALKPTLESPPQPTVPAQARLPEFRRPRDVQRTGASGDVASDSLLLARCRTGDGVAWHELVDRYQRLVFSVALRDGLDVEDASRRRPSSRCSTRSPRCGPTSGSRRGS